ncbi:Leucine-rich repeat and calponin like domain containing protein 1 [Dissostichus eleginoides]|uniref:Leucine-rich repeat and calponin like domain containing protein 1 n=1 Tax=Dissostichus eleginoides TaxID=100907 RepID=A0AAD9B6H2_DISEL|nr:Leucine-rich repeat and calponin like domain containing protein 1 [Dissostichus eleginoides]
MVARFPSQPPTWAWIPPVNSRGLHARRESAERGCMLQKRPDQTRHLSPTGPELHDHTPWNLKPDTGSWAARVIRGTHHAGGVTVWLRCPIRHTTDRPQLTPAWTDIPVVALSLGRSQAASIGACMAPMGPTYPSVCAGSSNSLKSKDLRC